MPNTIIRQVISFILLVLLQVLVLNNIHLFGIITPFLYIIFIINLPYNISRHWSLLIAFLLGLVVDMFTNTLKIDEYTGEAEELVIPATLTHETGGVLPVTQIGAAAFLMTEYTGVPYPVIAIAAIVAVVMRRN